MLIKAEPEQNFEEFAEMIIFKVQGEHQDADPMQLTVTQLKATMIEKPLLASFWHLEEEEKKILQ